MAQYVSAFGRGLLGDPVVADGGQQPAEGVPVPLVPGAGQHVVRQLGDPVDHPAGDRGRALVRRRLRRGDQPGPAGGTALGQPAVRGAAAGQAGDQQQHDQGRAEQGDQQPGRRACGRGRGVRVEQVAGRGLREAGPVLRQRYSNAARSRVTAVQDRPSHQRSWARSPEGSWPSPGTGLGAHRGPGYVERRCGPSEASSGPEVGGGLRAALQHQQHHPLVGRVDAVGGQPDAEEEQRGARGARPGRPPGRCRPPWCSGSRCRRPGRSSGPAHRSRGGRAGAGRARRRRSRNVQGGGDASGVCAAANRSRRGRSEAAGLVGHQPEGELRVRVGRARSSCRRGRCSRPRSR